MCQVSVLEKQKRAEHVFPSTQSSGALCVTILKMHYSVVIWLVFVGQIK